MNEEIEVIKGSLFGPDADSGIIVNLEAIQLYILVIRDPISNNVFFARWKEIPVLFLSFSVLLYFLEFSLVSLFYEIRGEIEEF